jgi:hypothetical protein
MAALELEDSEALHAQSVVRRAVVSAGAEIRGKSVLRKIHGARHKRIDDMDVADEDNSQGAGRRGSFVKQDGDFDARKRLDHDLNEAAEARKRARDLEEAATAQMLAHESTIRQPTVVLEPVTACPGEAAHGSKSLARLTSMRGRLGRPTKKLTIGCMMYTYHGKRQRLLDVITTWAEDCDKVYAFSDETWEVPELNFSTIEVHPDTGPEMYENLWRKTQRMWGRMAELWPRDKLDFLLVGGDDMFFIMPNLRVFLEDKSATSPTVLGQVQGRFVSGAGYIVNKAAAHIMSTCVGGAWNRTTGAEDVMVSSCLTSHGVEHPSKLARLNSHLFCAFGICRSSPDTLLYHYVSAAAQWDLFHAIYGDSKKPSSSRICAPPAPGREHKQDGFGARVHHRAHAAHVHSAARIHHRARAAHVHSLTDEDSGEENRAAKVHHRAHAAHVHSVTDEDSSEQKSVGRVHHRAHAAHVYSTDGDNDD